MDLYSGVYGVVRVALAFIKTHNEHSDAAQADAAPGLESLAVSLFPIIDTHSQGDPHGCLEETLSFVEEAGVPRTILAARGGKRELFVLCPECSILPFDNVFAGYWGKHYVK